MSAIGNIGGALIQGAFGLGGSALQFKQNKELAAIQNQYNIDMWNRQNEYNSPQAQMQRLQEAGLNPNLIYGNGSASTGNASSAPQMVAPEPVAVDKTMQELGKLFNVANLRSAMADAEIKEEEATRLMIENENARDERNALHMLDWEFDPVLGQFVMPTDSDSVAHIYGNPKKMRYFARVGFPTGYYRQAQRTYERYRGLKPYELYPSLINLRSKQAGLLVPQIGMRNYDWKNYEQTFWLDRASGNNYGGMIKALGHFLGWW